MEVRREAARPRYEGRRRADSRAHGGEAAGERGDGGGVDGCERGGRHLVVLSGVVGSWSGADGPQVPDRLLVGRLGAGRTPGGLGLGVLVGPGQGTEGDDHPEQDLAVVDRAGDEQRNGANQEGQSPYG